MSDTRNDREYEIRREFHRLAVTLKRIHDLYEEVNRLEEEEDALSRELAPHMTRADVKPDTVMEVGDILVRYEGGHIFHHEPTTSLYALDFRVPDEAAVEDAPPLECRSLDTRPVELRADDLSYCGSPTCDVCGGDRIAIPADAAQSVEEVR